MLTIALSRGEFDELKRLQIKRRWDWPAVFSSNPHGEIWPWVKYGLTPKLLRKDVRGVSNIVDRVAKSYRRERWLRGRFFIDEGGAFYKDQGGHKVKFVTFEISG